MLNKGVTGQKNTQMKFAANFLQFVLMLRFVSFVQEFLFD